jgi:hypothetical protein
VTASFLTDEHAPRVFASTLRSNGHTVVTAQDAIGEATDHERLLRYCAEEGYVLVTHDKKDFAGPVGDAVDHAGIVVSTDANFLRDRPEAAVRLVERVSAHYPPEELATGIVWLDQWRDGQGCPRTVRGSVRLQAARELDFFPVSRFASLTARRSGGLRPHRQRTPSAP